MAKTLSQVRSALRKRASKISGEDLLFIVNHLIPNDIQNDVYEAFGGEFNKSAEITIVAGTYSYTIANDYFDLVSAKTSDGQKLKRMYEADSAPVSSYKKAFWVNGNSIYFPKQQIDNLEYKVGEKIYIDYLGGITERTAEDQELPFSSKVQDLLFPVYVAGVEYFFFGRNKKITDEALALNNYNTAKLNVFSRFM